MSWGAEWPDAYKEWGDPYWQLSDLAPNLVEGIKDVVHGGLGVAEQAPEAFTLDTAIAQVLLDGWKAGLYPEPGDLQGLPPEMAVIWGVWMLLRDADYAPLQTYPPMPLLGIRAASTNTTYRVEVATFLPPKNSPYARIQLHSATRTHNPRNGTLHERTTSCLVTLDRATRIQQSQPLSLITKLRLRTIGTNVVEGRGLLRLDWQN